MEKLDGSLGILYQHAGAWHIATKGTFASAQAQWATDWLRRHIDPALLARFGAYTLLFEIVYPENRIVVDYGDRAGLTLLAARAIADGAYMPRAELMALAALLGVPLVRQLPLASLAAIDEALAQLTGTDGGGRAGRRARPARAPLCDGDTPHARACTIPRRDCLAACWIGRQALSVACPVWRGFRASVGARDNARWQRA